MLSSFVGLFFTSDKKSVVYLLHYFYMQNHFTARFSYASTFLVVIVLSICLSVTCMLCDKTKQCTADVLIPHESEMTLSFLSTTVVDRWHPLPYEIFAQTDPPLFQKHRLQQISTYNVSTVRNGEKSEIMTNIQSTTCFPTSYRWSAYVTPKSPKGWLNIDFLFFFWVKLNFSGIKSAKTSTSRVVE